MNTTAEEVIRALNLRPLTPEGGHFSRIYQSERTTQLTRGQRYLGTSIYYLITADNFSLLHRVQSDEIYHFYAGAPAELIQITEQGKLTTTTLGANLKAGECPQLVIPAKTWQAVKIKNPKLNDWTLFGATCVPGFEYEDFELANRESLIRAFPHLKAEITNYTA